MAVVEHCLTELSPEQTREEVAERVDDFIEGLTRPRKVTAPPKKASEGVLRYEGNDFLQALHGLNNDFLDRGWADGFPIVPPTPEEVEAMLSGTSRKRDDIVVVMDPGKGIGTVEKIAVNCVMAGCKPEHLRVVLAAVEAVSEPQFNLPLVSQSTGPHAPLLIINGPIRKEVGINFTGCTLGPGAPSRVNTAIGRALRLVMMNVGQAYPNLMDMDTIGSPNKYSMCMGENEEANPWGPLHVERGFRPDASTVTAFPCTTYTDVADMTSYTPEDLLDTFAGNAAVPTSTAWSWLLPDEPGWNREDLMVICPEHARILSGGGWSKEQIRLFMFHKARIALKFIKPSLGPGKSPEWNWLATQPDDMMMQIVRRPGAFHIAVVGASGPKSAFIDGMGEPVTREIVD